MRARGRCVHAGARVVGWPRILRYGSRTLFCADGRCLPTLSVAAWGPPGNRSVCAMHVPCTRTTWTCVTPCGLIGPVSTGLPLMQGVCAFLAPTSTKLSDCVVWFVTVMRTGPAPRLLGDRETPRGLI